MHPQLQEITATIRRARAELLDSYSVDALYALRVAIRRCRAILKQADTHSAHRLRKSWGGLATLSNRARDWDVFLLQAAELLTARESRRFEEANRRDIDSARDAVTDMLGSSLWRRHMDDWLEYTERAEGRAFTPEQSLAYLDRARAKVLLARERALQADDNHSWHKLRIAVKDLPAGRIWSRNASLHSPCWDSGTTRSCNCTCWTSSSRRRCMPGCAV
jgi:CHAD domain-containing protein